MGFHLPKSKMEVSEIMGKVIVGTTMSLDGFMNDETGSVARLYPDLEQLRETPMLQESIRSTGAVVIDDLQIGIVPILFGSGLRFFDTVSMANIQLEKTEIFESPSRIDIKYRVVKSL
jgi:hypothetical protein